MMKAIRFLIPKAKQAKFLCLSSLLAFSLADLVEAQTLIKGRIVDAASNTPLPFANVFIDRTTIGTAADGEGYFVLKGVPPGPAELLFSFVGYKLGRRVINVSGESDIGAIGLEVSERQLSEVEIKASRDKAWEKQLRRFEKIFLGDDAMAEGCKILNPWVLDFGKDKGKSLTASAEVPLQIENNSLGYSVEFYLDDFWKNPQGYLIEGKARFIQMSPVDEATTLRWLQNREKAYIGSLQHFFKSIISNRIRGEKFRLYTERPGQEKAVTRSVFFAQALEVDLMAYDTSQVKKEDLRPGIHHIRLKGRIEVHNYNERSKPRVYRDMGYKVSWITLENGEVTVNDEGFPLNPRAVVIAGDMANQRVSYMLPLNHERGKIAMEKELEIPSLARFHEKVYIHTDKPYYYPGEPLWFKAYINYADPILMDSLSKVVNVDLIGPHRKIIASKALWIADGTANGDFILSDTLGKGTYFLRAYTNWSRNFQDAFFVKALAMMGTMEKVDSAMAIPEIAGSDQMILSTNKKNYATREKITLTIKTLNGEGDPLSANLSVAVTDVKQVVPVGSTQSIMKDFGFNDSKESTEIKYPLEYGITVRGQYLDSKGHPAPATLHVVKLNPYSFYVTEADAMGMFQFSGLQLYDSINLLFKPDLPKNVSKGRVSILPDIVALGAEASGEVMLKSHSTEFPQRIVSHYEIPNNVRMLENVDVKASPDKDEEVLRYAKSYGRPDYVLEEKHINKSYGNLLLTLNGQLPGLVVRETNAPSNGDITNGSQWVIYTERARSSSIGFPPPPLILINNVATSGDAAAVLSSIDPNTITRIELTTRINPMHGSRGAGGVLAIFTKSGEEVQRSHMKADFIPVTVNGLAKPREFRAPHYEEPLEDHSLADYRSTLYWDPHVVTAGETGTATISFYAADLQTTYRVEVEGMVAGKPLQGVCFIEVGN